MRPVQMEIIEIGSGRTTRLGRQDDLPSAIPVRVRGVVSWRGRPVSIDCGGAGAGITAPTPHPRRVGQRLVRRHVGQFLNRGRQFVSGVLGTGALYTLKLSETSELNEDGHFMFSLADGSDWRYANAVALTATLTTVFSLKLSNAVRYVKHPRRVSRTPTPLRPWRWRPNSDAQETEMTRCFSRSLTVAADVAFFS
jgi:hypothetical protein